MENRLLLVLIHNTIPGRVDKTVYIPQPVMEVHTGLQGQPKKLIDADFLKEAMSNSWQITCTELAHVLGVHRNTLCLYMQQHNIEHKYTDISDADLNHLVVEFKRRWLESGIQYFAGFMRKHGVHVQYCWVIQSFHRVDRLGQVLQDLQVKARYKYHIKRPNALWHINGHHKLIRWGIVIHAFIDGFCWMVHVSINLAFSANYSSLQLGHCNTSRWQQPIGHCAWFVQAGHCGVWHTIPCTGWSWWWEYWCCNIHDHEEQPPPWLFHLGNEVHATSFLSFGMLIMCGTSSTQNCHIEHLWVKVGSQFARC